MERRRLGKADYMVSRIGLGTVQFGMDYGFTKKKSQKEVNDILECAVANGINLIDTAGEYGDSEKKIGKFISENNNDLIIATKLRIIPINESMKYEYLRDRICQSVEGSLNNLKLQKIDILQLHQTDELVIKNPDFWRVVEELKTQKMVGSFGVSVYEEEEARYLAENHSGVVDFFQVPYSVFDKRFMVLEELFRQESIGIISRSTFLKGMIPCAVSNIPEGLHGLKPYKERLSEIAEQVALSVEALALLFVFFDEFVDSTVLGVDSVEELESNISIVNKYNRVIWCNKELTDLVIEDMNLIDPRKWPKF